MTENDKSEKPAAEQTAENAVAAEPAKAAKPKASQKKASTAGKSGRAGPSRLSVLGILVLILIAGLASGGYLGWQWLNDQLSSLNETNQTLSQELESATAQLRRFQAQSEQTDEAWRSAFTDLEALVVESAQRWNAQSDRTENRWPLEEALTLTRLAAQRLQLDADARIAIRMLSSADEILAQFDQAAVLPLRRQLASDILALESTESADVNGLFFRLEAIGEQIRNLTWVPSPQSRDALPDNADPAEGFWESLKQVVVISRLDVPMEPPALQSDFERWRQHSLMLIEQTQLALLAGNQSLFDTALTQSLDQLEIMRGQLNLTAARQALNELKGAVLNPQWPELNASIDAIESYLTGTSASETADDQSQEANQ